MFSPLFSDTALRLKNAGLQVAKEKLLLDLADENSKLQSPATAKSAVDEGLASLYYLRSGIRDFAQRFPTAPAVAAVADVSWAGFPVRDRDIDALRSAEQERGQCAVVNATAIQVGVVTVLHLLRNEFKVPISLSTSWANGPVLIKEIGRGVAGIPNFVFAPDAPLVFSESPLVHSYVRSLAVNTTHQPVLRKPGPTTEKSTLWYFSDSSAHLQVKLADVKSPFARRFPALLLPKLRVPYDCLADLQAAFCPTRGSTGIQPGDLIILWEPAASQFARRYALETVPGHTLEITYSLFVHADTADRAPQLVSAFMNLFIMGWNFVRAHCERAVALLENDGDFWACLLSGAGVNLAGVVSGMSVCSPISNGLSHPEIVPSDAVIPRIPDVRRKRSTVRGEAREKLIAALTKHHQYENGSCLNLEPIGNNELARLASVAKRTASAFFKREFKGHVRYRAACQDATYLAASLKMLNNEYSPHHLFGRPPGEGDGAE